MRSTEILLDEVWINIAKHLFRTLKFIPIFRNFEKLYRHNHKKFRIEVNDISLNFL